jgi:hypothetical protein
LYPRSLHECVWGAYSFSRHMALRANSRALRAPDPRLSGRGPDGRCGSLSLLIDGASAGCLSLFTAVARGYEKSSFLNP